MKQMSKKVVYVGKDLEAMSFALKYHRWILEEFRPFFGKKLVEVGAGTGSFSEMLLGEKINSLSLIEPSDMFNFLKQNIDKLKTEIKVNYYNSIFVEATANLSETPDTIIYVNVLEHIKDDVAELQKIYKTLEEGGHCLIFVPAFQLLFGPLDEKVGHYRRYNRKEIEDKALSVGFKIQKSKYFDFAGFFPWFIKYKILKFDNIQSDEVIIYDKFVVPVTKRIESLFRFPIGKNILIVLKK